MKVLVLVAGVALLSACGGSGTSGVPGGGTGSGAAPVTQARSSVTFTLAIPAGTKSSTASIKPKYVSVSMQSLVVTLISQNGTAVSPPQPYAVNVSSCPTVSGIRTCSLMVPASVGTDTFVVATYDAAQSSANPTTLTGNLLSTASASTTVVASTANTLALTLNGVVHSISLALGTTTPSTGAVATIPLTVTARDFDNNIIIGPGSYTQPITLLDSDTSGATTLSTTSVTGPSTVVTVAYTGAPTTAGFLATAPGGITASSPTLVSQTSRIFISDDTSNTVEAFNTAGALQSSPPPFGGSNFNFPQGIAVDRNDDVYVAYITNSSGPNNVVREFNPAGTVILTISGFTQPEGVAVDSAGKVYVADNAANDVTVFPANGSVTLKTNALLRVTSGLVSPDGVAVDYAGNMYVANFGNNNVLEYGPSGGTASRTISNGISTPYGVAVNSTGTVYVTNEGGYKVTTYASTGANPAPLTTTFVTTTGLNNLFGIAVDQAGNIYVVTQASGANPSTVVVYPAGGGASHTVPNPTINNYTPYGVAVY